MTFRNNPISYADIFVLETVLENLVPPTKSPWLNWVERRFQDLIMRNIRRASFNSIRKLIVATDKCLGALDADPKSFVWHGSVDSIRLKPLVVDYLRTIH